MVKCKTGFKKRAFAALGFALCYAACALLCLFPLLHTLSPAGEEEYTVKWSDGTVSTESYAAAFSSLAEAEAGCIVLEREGLRGEIAAGDGYAQSVSVLQTGNLPALLTAKFEGLSRLERASLWNTFGNAAYYSADLFAFDGGRVQRTSRRAFETLVLLDGGIPNDTLRTSGAAELVLRAEAKFEASALIGTNVATIEAEPPYRVGDGAVYLDTPAGRRLLAALPSRTSLTVGDCDFCDEGALTPCTSLVSLTLPFVGSAARGAESGGRLAWNFGGSVPETLKRVKITGGALSEFAFSGCPMLEELDLCGLSAEAPSAFAGCARLQRLHIAAALSLPGFARSELPCGCYLYERSTS